MTRHKPKVLFLSTGNAARSLIAEGFLRSLTGDRIDVVSVGVERDASSPLANEVMQEAGIDISRQKTKSVAESLKEPFGHVITICDTSKERNPVFPFAIAVLHWNIADPNSADGLIDQKKEAFRRVRDELHVKVKQFVADIPQMESSELSIA
jgi:arsenate reductase (thioredoxin)